MFDEL
jgi:hypothetical protein